MTSHFFDPEVATKVGVNSAIIFSKLLKMMTSIATIHHPDDRMLRLRAIRDHFHNGQWWVYCSVPAVLKTNPYLGEKAVKNAFQKLEQANFIVSGKYNRDPCTHTKWYALGEAARHHLDAIERGNLCQSQVSDSELQAVDNIFKNSKKCRENLPNSLILNFGPFGTFDQAERADRSALLGLSLLEKEIENKNNNKTVAKNSGSRTRPADDDSPQPIPPDWYPSQNTIDAIPRYTDDMEYALRLINEFVADAIKTGKTSRTWGSQYLAYVRDSAIKRKAATRRNNDPLWMDGNSDYEKRLQGKAVDQDLPQCMKPDHQQPESKAVTQPLPDDWSPCDEVVDRLITENQPMDRDHVQRKIHQFIDYHNKAWNPGSPDWNFYKFVVKGWVGFDKVNFLKNKAAEADFERSQVWLENAKKKTAKDTDIIGAIKRGVSDEAILNNPFRSKQIKDYIKANPGALSGNNKNQSQAAQRLSRQPKAVEVEES